MTVPQPNVAYRDAEHWPPLPYAEWRETSATLHLWTQIVGKIRGARTPWLNHSWHVPFYLTTRGLTTSPIPCGERCFEIDFDFITHRLLIHRDDGELRSLPLEPRPVADFYREFMAQLNSLGLETTIHPVPNEVLEAIPFAEDTVHAAYDAAAAHRFWRVLVQADRVLKQFRSEFIGKCSPVHFFWGSFDLAVTRFSGRRAPPHPGGVPNCPDWVTRDAYSHEVSSCGFWPGNDAMPFPLFYAYAYPQPPGYSTTRLRPDAASYDNALGEFILPYDAVRQAASPVSTLLDFLHDSYGAAASLGDWDRTTLERASDAILPVPRSQLPRR
ncbi:MAG: DUF5996 family protein [Bacteroidota bacterium]